MKALCNPDTLASIRLCRQVQPVLPLVKVKRPRVCVLMDIIVDGINHNLRRRLDIDLYVYADGRPFHCHLPADSSLSTGSCSCRSFEYYPTLAKREYD